MKDKTYRELNTILKTKSCETHAETKQRLKSLSVEEYIKFEIKANQPYKSITQALKIGSIIDIAYAITEYNELVESVEELIQKPLFVRLEETEFKDVDPRKEYASPFDRIILQGIIGMNLAVYMAANQKVDFLKGGYKVTDAIDEGLVHSIHQGLSYDYIHDVAHMTAINSYEQENFSMLYNTINLIREKFPQLYEMNK